MDAVLIAIATLVPLLLILVVVHEFGHFATARAMGIKVLEFGVGFPPRAFGFYTGRTPVLIDASTQFIGLDGPSSLQRGQQVKVSSTEDVNGNLLARVIELSKKRAGAITDVATEKTDDDLLNHEGKIRSVGDGSPGAAGSMVLADMLYSVNWAPLGGFVRLAGESNPRVPRSLASKGPGTRFLVLIAGPFMNAILPIAIFTAVFMIPQDVALGQVSVLQVVDGTAAAEGQVQAGDIVLAANGEKIENGDELVREIQLNGGSQMELLVERDGREQPLFLRPRFETATGTWKIGVHSELIVSRVESRSDPIWEAIPNGFVSSWETVVLFKQAIGGYIAEGSSPELSGPIGIAQVTGEVTRSGGLTGWLGIGILLSINLAILNILPIPMLDGGRMAFVAIEWVRRGKRVPPEKEGLVHLIGFAVLMGGILLISVNDIQRLIDGRSFLGG